MAKIIKLRGPIREFTVTMRAFRGGGLIRGGGAYSRGGGLFEGRAFSRGGGNSRIYDAPVFLIFPIFLEL